MADVFEVPTTPTPQTFSIALAGVLYRLTLKWNVTAQVWALDIDGVDGVPVLCGVPVVTGVDLLEPFAYLELGGKLFAMTDNDADLPPAFGNLGTTAHIYWIAQ